MTTKQKHTPGTYEAEPAMPHHLREAIPGKAVRIFSTDPGPDFPFTVALVTGVDDATIAANAALLTAAPDLLAVAKKYLRAIESGNVTNYGYNDDEARAAIQKAEGGR